MEGKKRNLRRTAVAGALLLVLLAAVFTAAACRYAGLRRERPLEPGQVFRFRREGVQSVTVRHKDGSGGEKSVTLETPEELDRFVEMLNGFRYQSVVPAGPRPASEEERLEARLNAYSGQEEGYSFWLLGTEGMGDAGGFSGAHAFGADRVEVDGTVYRADAPYPYFEELIGREELDLEQGKRVE